MSNPLVKSFMDIRRNEWPLALSMFGYFFLVITSFWILKPIKKSLFLQYYDASGLDLWTWHLGAAQAELLAKVMNMIVAFVAVVVFTWLVRKFRRQQLTYIFTIFFMVAYVLYSLVISKQGDLIVWSFYLFGDLYSTLMVATFFAFLNDSVSSQAAKRLYGLIGLGGVTGGVFGTMFVRIWIKTLSIPAWLWICFGIAAVIALLAWVAGSMVDRIRDDEPVKPAPKPMKTTPEKDGNPAFEGALLVFKNSYLLAIVGIVGLYEIVSTLMDFQFSATIVHYLDGEAIGQQFSTVFLITNITSMVVQLFLTSFIMTRLGLTTALLALPFAVILGSFGFLAFPVLWVGSFLNTADNGFSYSINQSAKETLYVPTTRDEKYKAKAFIDMFVQRFAKALAVGISLIVTTVFTSFESLRWLSLVTLAVAALWVFIAFYAGKRFKNLSGEMHQ